MVKRAVARSGSERFIEGNVMKLDTPLQLNASALPYLHERLVIQPGPEKSTGDPTTPVFIFDTHLQAEDAIHSLNKAGFDVKKLSLIGKGYHSEEHALGFYTAGDRIKAWGSAGAFWGGIWGLLLAPAVFFLPGLGLVALAGPMAAALVGALEGAAVVGGLSALGAALTSIGVPEDEVIKFEKALKVDKYVLMVHGDAVELRQAREVLANAMAISAGSGLPE
jgi:hypothetical protein